MFLTWGTGEWNRMQGKGRETHPVIFLCCSWLSLGSDIDLTAHACCSSGVPEDAGSQMVSAPPPSPRQSENSLGKCSHPLTEVLFSQMDEVQPCA